jgi:hypothetical protein
MKTTYEGIFKIVRWAVAGVVLVIMALPALTTVSNYI